MARQKYFPPIKVTGLTEPYKGPVVRWSPQRVLYKHTKTANSADVTFIAQKIIDRAERIGAVVYAESWRAQLKMYVVKIGTDTTPMLRDRNKIVMDLRMAMMALYRDDEIVIGIGSPRNTRVRVHGSIRQRGIVMLQMLVTKKEYLTGNRSVCVRDPFIDSFKMKKVFLIAAKSR